MKLLWLIGILTLVALGAPAKAVSVAAEIVPEHAQECGVKISAARIPNGDVRFTVEIRLVKPYQFEDYIVALCNVRAEGSIWHPVYGFRKLAGEETDGGIRCIFTVTEKEMEDPTLSFYWRIHPKDGGGFNASYRFARLQNFLNP